MYENISHQRARALVGQTGWNLMKQGKVVYSRNMRYTVWNAGQGLYRMQPCSNVW